MFKVILVPVDRSPASSLAMAHAASMAVTFGARLILLHVIDVAGLNSASTTVNPLDWQIRKAEAEAYLQDRADTLQRHGLEIEWHMLEGDAAEQTHEFVKTHPVDLVVLGARGQSATREWHLGSVAFKLAEHARTSILIVRSSVEPIEQPEALEDVTYQRILLPLDGSVRAECVLPVAAALARKHNAQITLAHVVQRPEMPRRTPLTHEETRMTDAIVESNQAEARRYLAELKGRLHGEVADRVMVDADAGSTLHQLAANESTDLVVLTAHGYSNQATWPYGSLTGSFVMHGITSVLVIQDTR